MLDKTRLYKIGNIFYRKGGVFALPYILTWVDSMSIALIACEGSRVTNPIRVNSEMIEACSYQITPGDLIKAFGGDEHAFELKAENFQEWLEKVYQK